MNGKARCVFVRQNSKNCGSEKSENTLANNTAFSPRCVEKQDVFLAAKTECFGPLIPRNSEEKIVGYIDINLLHFLDEL